MRLCLFTAILVLLAGATPASSYANCADGKDNDGDGWVDKADPDCQTSDGVEAGYSDPWSYSCNDGIDNDGDGRIDARDTENCQTGFDEEDGDCYDGVDNDLDGWTDWDDPDCMIDCDGWCYFSESGFSSTWGCNDGLDDDADGWADADDPDCTWAGANELGFGVAPCNDGIDNEGDGYIDGEDPECQSAEGVEWATPPNSCRDGRDDDGDGWVDGDDPDCFDDGGYEKGFNASYTCNDGYDNDFDGMIDAKDKDNCMTATDLESGDCGDGKDNDGDGWIDIEDPDCNVDIDCSFWCFVSENNAFFGDFECNDGLDNDGDRLIDAQDPECLDAYDEEAESSPSCAPGARKFGIAWILVLLPYIRRRRSH